MSAGHGGGVRAGGGAQAGARPTIRPVMRDDPGPAVPPVPRRSSRRGAVAVAIALTLIVGLGLGLRIDAATHPPERITSPDARGYVHLAQSVYERGAFAHVRVAKPELFSPGPVLFAAAVYEAIGSPNSEAVRLLVALMGAATILLAFLLGRRLTAVVTRRAPPATAGLRAWASAGGAPAALGGLAAALVVAIYPSFLYTNRVLLSEPFAAFTIVAAMVGILWAWERRAIWWWIAPGVLLGATAMFRPEYLAIALVVVPIAFVRVWRRGDGLARGAAAAVVLALAIALPIAPWTVRNFGEYGRFVPISAGGGKSFYIGTHLEGNGNNWDTLWWLLRTYPQLRAPEYRDRGEVQWIEVVNTYGDRVYDGAARIEYPDLPPDQGLSRMAQDNLREYALGRPLEFAGLLASKVWETWRRGEWAPMREPFWVWFHRTVVFLGLAGLIGLAWSRRWEALVLAVPIVGITLLSMVVNTVPRRSLPLLAIVAPLAAAGAALLAVQLRAFGERARRSRRPGHPGRAPRDPAAPVTARQPIGATPSEPAD